MNPPELAVLQTFVNDVGGEVKDPGCKDEPMSEKRIQQMITGGSRYLDTQQQRVLAMIRAATVRSAYLSVARPVLDINRFSLPDSIKTAMCALLQASTRTQLDYNISQLTSQAQRLWVLLDEALKVAPTGRGAVFITDRDRRRLAPKAMTGIWGPGDTSLASDDPLLKPVLEDARMLAVCDVRSTDYGRLLPGAEGFIVIPLLGNARVVGLLILADEEGRREQFTNETKLLSALGYQAGLSIENALLLEENRAILIGSFRALIKTLEASSTWTAGHSERVAEYSRRVAVAMGMKRDFVDQLVICGTLHDLGKVAVPDGILNQSAELSTRERDLLDDHPSRGAAILEEIGPLSSVVDGIRHHHERWDGKGYPVGLKGEEIPIMARIIGVADAFDAMTTDRPYRAKVDPSDAVEELYCEAGIQFDPEIVSTFVVMYRKRGERKLRRTRGSEQRL